MVKVFGIIIVLSLCYSLLKYIEGQEKIEYIPICVTNGVKIICQTKIKIQKGVLN